MREINRLLDNGAAVVIFKNQLGSYTAFASAHELDEFRAIMEESDGNGHLTDDFTPEKAISRLADKVLGCGDYQGKEQS